MVPERAGSLVTLSECGGRVVEFRGEVGVDSGRLVWRKMDGE